jgi:hypothetical protein
VAHRELKPCRPGDPVHHHTQGLGPRIGVSRRDDVDERSNGGMAMQEVFQPCTRRKNEERYVERIMQHHRRSGQREKKKNPSSLTF